MQKLIIDNKVVDKVQIVLLAKNSVGEMDICDIYGMSTQYMFRKNGELSSYAQQTMLDILAHLALKDTEVQVSCFDKNGAMITDKYDWYKR